MNHFERVRHVAATGSTNDDMAQILGALDARGLTIAADYQERGSGRKGRQWIAPAGSALLFTTALPDPMAARDLWIVPFWMALAVRRALLEYGVGAQLQWPNDVLIDGRKAGGILSISRVTGESAWAACGVGLNVRRPADAAALAAIDPPPAFLSDIRTIDRNELLEKILHHVEQSYDDLHAPDSVAHRWEEAADIPGARYRILEDDETGPFECVALRLAPGGGLVVRAEGRVREIALADARVLRTD